MMTDLHSTSLWMLAGFAVVLAVSSGCGGEPDPQYIEVDTTGGADQTIVFVDASKSAHASDYTMEVFEDSLRALAKARLDEPGDRMAMYPVHEETTSKVGQWRIENDISVPEWSEFKNDRQSDRIQFNGQVNRFLEKAEAQSVEALQEMLTNEAYARWTDLWGTLQVLSEEVNTGTGAARVYYFSDMFESVPGKTRRNFDRSPPTSKAEAETWAAEDADRIRKLIKTRPSVLEKVRVRVLPGGLATKDHADAVKYYWEHLFREMGVGKVTYN